MYASCAEEWEMNYYRFTPYAEQVAIQNPTFAIMDYDSGLSEVIAVVNGDGTVLDERCAK